MSLRIIYGRNGSGKTKECFKEINKLLNQQLSNLFYIVPEQFTFESELSFVKSTQNNGVLDANVISFKRLARKIIEEKNIFVRNKIDNSTKILRVFNLLEKYSENFEYFNRCSKKTGFINQLISLFTEFKRYNVSPEVINKIIENSNSNNSTILKLKDISFAYEKYLSEVNCECYDSEDDLNFLISIMDDSRAIKAAHIWINKFAGFTGQEYSIIKKFLVYSKQLTIALCLDELPNVNSVEFLDQTDVFFQTKKTLVKLINIAKNENIEVEFVKIDATQDEKNDLNFLECNLLDYNLNEFDGCVENVSVNKCLSMREEMDEVAREISRIVRNSNVRYNEISIISSQIDAYKSVIDSTFKKYNIPYFLDSKKRLINNQIVNMLINVLQIMSTGWKSNYVLQYLHCGLNGVEEVAVDKIHFYAFENGIEGFKWKNSQVINRISNFTQPLVNFERSLKSKFTGSQFCIHIYKFFSEINLEQNILNIINEFEVSGDMLKAKEYELAWAAICDVLDQMYLEYENKIIDFEICVDLLKAIFEDKSIALTPATKDQVSINTLQRSVFNNPKICFIIGVNEGCFPVNSRIEGILNSNDRNFLAVSNVDLAPNDQEIVFNGIFDAYRALSCASEKLYIFYSLMDLNNNSLLPASIISTIREKMPNVKFNSFVGKVIGDCEAITVENVYNDIINALRLLNEGEKVPAGYAELFQLLKTEYNDLYNKIIYGIYYKNVTNKISPDVVKALYSGGIFSSISKIERYALCPFSHFIEYILKLHEWQTPTVSVLDYGSIAHEVLEKFFRQMASLNGGIGNITEDEITRILFEKTSLVLDEFQKQKSFDTGAFKYQMHRANMELKDAVWAYLNSFKHTQFVPSMFELSFGQDGDLPPIEYLVNNYKVVFQGKIDRVDIAEVEDNVLYRIIDYKTSNKKFDLENVSAGSQIQPIIYADVINKNWEKLFKCKPGLSGMFYQVISANYNTKFVRNSDPNYYDKKKAECYKEKGYDFDSGKAEATFSQLIENTEKVVSEHLHSIVSGNCDARPLKTHSSNACDFCNKAGICKFNTLLGNNYRQVSEQNLIKSSKNAVKEKT